jgi:hypothetical protein
MSAAEWDLIVGFGRLIATLLVTGSVVAGVTWCARSAIHRGEDR